LHLEKGINQYFDIASTYFFEVQRYGSTGELVGNGTECGIKLSTDPGILRYDNILKRNGEFILTVKLTSENSKSVEMNIKVSFNGSWDGIEATRWN
jgi:diaminopimelate epimerase